MVTAPAPTANTKASAALRSQFIGGPPDVFLWSLAVWKAERQHRRASSLESLDASCCHWLCSRNPTFQQAADRRRRPPPDIHFDVLAALPKHARAISDPAAVANAITSARRLE